MRLIDLIKICKAEKIRKGYSICFRLDSKWHVRA